MNVGAAVALLALLGALALPAAAQPPPALVPVQVAIDALPVAVRTAVREARDQLVADTAQRQLEEARAYVQGFQQLPSGQAALADPQVQQAYGWTERAVETLLAVPTWLERVESAAATCESYGPAAGRGAAERAVRGGREALGALEALSGAAQALAEEAPRGLGLDLAPFDAAAAELEGWTTSRGVEVGACLDELALALGLPPPGVEVLAAILVPETTWRGGSFRVLGSWPSGPVTVRAPSLGLDRTASADGTFQVRGQVPRGAALGNHTLEVAAGGQRVELRLGVILAPSTLTLHAPRELRPGASFTLRATVSSPAGLAEVDLGRLSVSWNGTERTLAPSGGLATARLDAGGVERTAVLDARYSGTDVVAPAEASLTLRILEPEAAVAPVTQDPDARQPPRLLDGVAGWSLLLLVLLLLAIAAAAAWRLTRHRPQDPAAPPPERSWPGAASYAAAMGLLFTLLRRLGLVPPGRTVREWAESGHAPLEVADAFEKVRYGGRPEGASLRSRGIPWLRQRWLRP